MEKKLYQMRNGEKGIIKKIKEDFQVKVAGMGIRVGKKIKILTRQPMKGPIVAVVDEAKTSLGLKIAKEIIVEVKK